MTWAKWAEWYVPFFKFGRSSRAQGWNLESAVNHESYAMRNIINSVHRSYFDFWWDKWNIIFRTMTLIAFRILAHPKKYTSKGLARLINAVVSRASAVSLTGMLIWSAAFFLRKSGSPWDDWPCGKFLSPYLSWPTAATPCPSTSWHVETMVQCLRITHSMVYKGQPLRDTFCL